MIQTRPRDLFAIQENGRYYYCLVLSKQIMLGGQLVYAFYFTSESLATADELLNIQSDGFHRITDLIAAKREGTLVKISSNVPIDRFDNVLFFRQDSPDFGPDRTWAIWDRDGHLARCPATLTDEEWSYPVFVCSLHYSMCEQIDNKWHPMHDRLSAPRSW